MLCAVILLGHCRGGYYPPAWEVTAVKRADDIRPYKKIAK